MMVDLNKAAITLGEQVGGADAGAVTKDHCMALRRALAAESRTTFSDSIKEVALILRIDGEIQSWNRRGVDYLRIQKKLGYVTADIFVPREIWFEGNARTIRHFLASEVKTAIELLVVRIKKAKIEFDSEKLISGVDRALVSYLKDFVH